MRKACDELLRGRPWRSLLLALCVLLAACGAAADSADDQLRDRLIRESIAAYRGQCPCPYSKMRNGKECGAQSSYSQTGGRKQLCFRRDIDAAKLAAARANGGRLPAGTKPAPKAKAPGQLRQAIPDVTGRATVIDGDTLEIARRRIRLRGIDAFESGQTCSRSGQAWRCGQAAAIRLDELIGGATVHCRISEVDRYQRLVGTCQANGRTLNQALVAEGLALAYRQYAKDYVRDEDAARAAGRGMWGKGVRFQRPEEWRRERSER